MPGLRLIAFTLVISVFTGCVIFDDQSKHADDGGFTGQMVGCGDLWMYRANTDGSRVLQVRVSDERHFRDTAYEISIGSEVGTRVIIERFDRKVTVPELFCNDIVSDPRPVSLDTVLAVSGTLSLVIYGMDVDTFGTLDRPFYWKTFQVDAELRDVRFNDSSRIEKLRMDSVWAGWLAG